MFVDIISEGGELVPKTSLIECKEYNRETQKLISRNLVEISEK
jgi:hypothetical protein